ncbi:MAG: hypothetical protein IJV97_04720 [Alphaproteobacteria bacterium]|nr:hypothetical protein [Alphaproteobacteria bacterium]
MRMSYKLLALIAIFALSGCFGTYYEPEPVGIGRGSNELKLSPCACMEVELPKNLPDWFVATI